MEFENHTAPGITGAEKIIDEAKKAFEDAAGIDMQVTKGVQPKKNLPGAVVQFYASGAKTKKYYPEIKKELTRATLAAYLAERSGRFETPGMLISWYVNPQMAERLKEKDIAFIDAAGNAYINDPPIYIYITGRKKSTSRTKSQLAELLNLRVLKLFLPCFAALNWRKLLIGTL